MEIPKKLTVLFSDNNGYSMRVKLETCAFISGTQNSVIKWMVLYPYGNVDMEDIKSYVTLFFLACRYNPNTELIRWLIITRETDLNFVNSNNENVVEYLAKSSFNSQKISSRIKLLLKYHKYNLDKITKKGETLFNLLCYSGYSNIIEYVLLNGYKLEKESIIYLIKKIEEMQCGKNTDYWSIEKVNEYYFYDSLEGVLELLKSKL
jgi:hypothetical protein